MKFILGKKENMSEFFGEDGKVIPVTVISTYPMKVIDVLSNEKHGYKAVKVGYGEQKKQRISKPVLGVMKGDTFKGLKEFRIETNTELKAGDQVENTFSVDEKVRVSSISKGKGFQGVVKRHGFGGGPRTHGQKHSEREPGSIGGGLRTRVPKGMRMAGRMGSDRITQKNLKVVFVDKENNVMLIKGAIAGRKGTLVEIIAQ